MAQAQSHETPRSIAFMAGLHLANANRLGAWLELVELIAWMSFNNSCFSGGVAVAPRDKPPAVFHQ